MKLPGLYRLSFGSNPIASGEAFRPDITINDSLFHVFPAHACSLTYAIFQFSLMLDLVLRP